MIMIWTVAWISAICEPARILLPDESGIEEVLGDQPHVRVVPGDREHELGNEFDDLLVGDERLEVQAGREGLELRHHARTAPSWAIPPSG